MSIVWARTVCLETQKGYYGKITVHQPFITRQRLIQYCAKVSGAAVTQRSVRNSEVKRFYILKISVNSNGLNKVNVCLNKHNNS